MKRLALLIKYTLGVVLFYFMLFFVFQSCLSIQKNIKKFNHATKMVDMYDNSNSPFPNENFVFLQRSIKSRDEVIVGGLNSASGVIVDRKGNKVYALTAAHWCVPATDEELFYIIKTTGLLGYDTVEDYKNNIFLNVDYFGKNYDLEVLDLNTHDDICLVSFESEYARYSKRISVSDNYPKIGEQIYAISSPMGVKSPTIRNHFVGKFSGCLTDEPECLYTIPGTHGSSGSGVLNEDGELVGILTIAINGFNNITGGVKLSAINEILSSNNIR